LSPTPTLEDDEQYEDRRRNYKANQNARRRRKGEDLIWRTRLERQEYNLNQRARALDICEAYLCRSECRCDHHEAEVHTARVSGTGRCSGSGFE
jgi:hypothetical protein